MGIGMAFIMNKEENRLFGMPLCAIYNSFKSDFLMTNTASYCPWQSSQQKPDEWKHDLEYLFTLLQTGKIYPKCRTHLRRENLMEFQCASLGRNIHPKVQRLYIVVSLGKYDIIFFLQSYEKIIVN